MYLAASTSFCLWTKIVIEPHWSFTIYNNCRCYRIVVLPSSTSEFQQRTSVKLKCFNRQARRRQTPTSGRLRQRGKTTRGQCSLILFDCFNLPMLWINPNQVSVIWCVMQCQIFEWLQQECSLSVLWEFCSWLCSCYCRCGDLVIMRMYARLTID